jgi:ubiquitin C-terminal hydrolase
LQAGVVTARKLFKIHALSKIMILHLKRFSYGNHGSAKIYKPLYFPLELVLNRDLLSSPSSEVIVSGYSLTKLFKSLEPFFLVHQYLNSEMQGKIKSMCL